MVPLNYSLACGRLSASPYRMSQSSIGPFLVEAILSVHQMKLLHLEEISTQPFSLLLGYFTIRIARALHKRLSLGIHKYIAAMRLLTTSSRIPKYLFESVIFKSTNSKFKGASGGGIIPSTFDALAISRSDLDEPQIHQIEEIFESAKLL
jgi:hypothetical protein